MAATTAMIVQAAMVRRVDNVKWRKRRKMRVWTSTLMTKIPTRKCSTVKSSQRSKSAQRKCSHVTIYAVIPILHLHLILLAFAYLVTLLILFLHDKYIYLFSVISLLQLGRNYTNSVLKQRYCDKPILFLLDNMLSSCLVYPLTCLQVYTH